VHQCPFYAPPVLGIALADDDDIKRHSEGTKRTTKTHHLGMTVARVALHDKEIEIAVRLRIAARPRAEEHDLDGIGSQSRKGAARNVNDLLSNHGNTVAKPADQATGTQSQPSAAPRCPKRSACSSLICFHATVFDLRLSIPVRQVGEQYGSYTGRDMTNTSKARPSRDQVVCSQIAKPAAS